MFLVSCCSYLFVYEARVWTEVSLENKTCNDVMWWCHLFGYVSVNKTLMMKWVLYRSRLCVHPAADVFFTDWSQKPKPRERWNVFNKGHVHPENGKHRFALVSGLNNMFSWNSMKRALRYAFSRLWVCQRCYSISSHSENGLLSCFYTLWLP